MTTPVEVDSLPPTQYLILDVLAARWRTGETLWTFPSRLRPAVRALAELGLVHEMHGITEGTIRARLTEVGRNTVLDDNYTPPNRPEPGWIRVVVVVNWRKQRVHSITSDNGQAQDQVRELVAKYGDPLAATMTAWAIRAEKETMTP
jgi:hypothetical protein